MMDLRIICIPKRQNKTIVFSIIELPNQQVLLAVLPHALHDLSES